MKNTKNIDDKRNKKKIDSSEDKAIIERKKLLKNLVLFENFEFLQEILDAVPIPLFYKDKSLCYRGCNKAFEDYVGRKKEDIIGKTMYDINSQKFADEYSKKDYELLKKKGTQSYEGQIITADAISKKFIFHKATYTNNSGEILGIAGAIIDITDRKNAEEQLLLNTSALNAAANAIVITDISGKILWINDAFTSLTGYSKNEVIGKNPRILKSGHNTDSFYKDMWDNIMLGNVWHNELTNKRKDSTLYVEEMTITPVRINGSQITHFIAIKQDITSRKNAEESLKNKNEELEKFYKIAVERELKMIELKNKILELESKLEKSSEKTMSVQEMS
ncbi:MAG: PAS domain-containing protein [Candidatus Woesearchaeota archaeon]